ICAQARSWTILSLLILAAFILLRSREQGSAVSGIRTLIMGCVLALAAAASVYATIPRTLIDSAQGLSDRLDEDTRSGNTPSSLRWCRWQTCSLGGGRRARGTGEVSASTNTSTTGIFGCYSWAAFPLCCVMCRLS